MTVRVVKLIYCDSDRAGKGVDENPIRKLERLYTLDGRLICQFDSFLTAAPEDGGHGGTFIALPPSISTDRFNE